MKTRSKLVGRTLIAVILASATLSLTNGSALAAEDTSDGPCSMLAMMSSTSTPDGGAMNMMSMDAQAMALMAQLMASGGCSWS